MGCVRKKGKSWNAQVRISGWRNFTKSFSEKSELGGVEVYSSSKAMCEHHHKRALNEFCKSMYHYGKNNFPILLKKYPQYKDDLGGNWIYTLKGLFLFNPIVRWFVGLLNRYLPNIFLTRYMVIDAVIRGARSFTL